MLVPRKLPSRALLAVAILVGLGLGAGSGQAQAAGDTGDARKSRVGVLNVTGSGDSADFRVTLQ